MLKKKATVILVKRLMLNELQNRAFYLVKWVILQAKTGYIAVRNVPFRYAKRHMRKDKPAEGVF